MATSDSSVDRFGDSNNRREVYRGERVLHGSKPTIPDDDKDLRWLRSYGSRREKLPVTTLPFTRRALPESQHNEVLDSARQKSVIETIGYVQPYTERPSYEGSRSPVAVYQLTERAYDFLVDCERETTMPCDCDSEGFKNVGEIDRAPFDGTYYACKGCERLFPEREVR